MLNCQKFSGLLFIFTTNFNLKNCMHRVVSPLLIFHEPRTDTVNPCMPHFRKNTAFFLESLVLQG